MNAVTTSQVETLRLSNGMLLLLNHLPDAPRLAMVFFLPGGNTRDSVPGLMDVVDRLLLKGTQSRSQEQLSQDIDSLTLDVDADTRRDYSLISATLLEEDLKGSFELIGDIFYHATLNEFEREKQKMIGEIAMELDSQRARASDLLIRTVFEGTSYGVTSSVFLENIEKLDDIALARAHYQKIYHPERVTLSVSGNLAHCRDELISLLESTFVKTEITPEPLEAIDQAALKSLTIAENQMVTFARDDSSQAHIYQGWLAPSINHDDFYPMVVLNTILGAAGLSSRLFLELRDKQGLAYNVRSVYDSYRYQGLFYLYIGTEPKNKQKCLDGFADECQKLMQVPVSEKELAETKENILGRRTVFLETAAQQAGYIGSNFVMGRNLDDIDAMSGKINAVSAEDIMRVANTYLSRPSVVSVVGPSEIL